MHENFDRGMIKWQPFNSVISSQKIITEILNEKNKIALPIISDEDKKFIENKIIDFYYMGESIKLKYFYAGKVYELNDKIKKIDFTYHRIYFSNKILLFNQIIKIIE